MAPSEDSEKDGFKSTNKTFQYPRNPNSLDPAKKRMMTICNLYANHHLSIGDIVRVLDEQHAHVITVLIEQGLIVERRQNPRPVKVERRRSLLKNRLDKVK